MSDESVMRDLFDRWERVWHEGQYNLIPACVGSHTTNRATGLYRGKPTRRNSRLSGRATGSKTASWRKLGLPCSH